MQHEIAFIDLYVEDISFRNLNEWSELCHTLSSYAGWWPFERSTELYATKIALIHSEASEMLEGLRKGIPDNHLPTRKMEEVECADLLIRIFDYAGARGLDLDGAIIEKLKYNVVRSDHRRENRERDGGKKI